MAAARRFSAATSLSDSDGGGSKRFGGRSFGIGWSGGGGIPGGGLGERTGPPTRRLRPWRWRSQPVAAIHGGAPGTPSLQVIVAVPRPTSAMGTRCRSRFRRRNDDHIHDRFAGAALTGLISMLARPVASVGTSTRLPPDGTECSATVRDFVPHRPTGERRAIGATCDDRREHERMTGLGNRRRGERKLRIDRRRRRCTDRHGRAGRRGCGVGGTVITGGGVRRNAGVGIDRRCLQISGRQSHRRRRWRCDDWRRRRWISDGRTATGCGGQRPWDAVGGGATTGGRLARARAEFARPRDRFAAPANSRSRKQRSRQPSSTARRETLAISSEGTSLAIHVRRSEVARAEGEPRRPVKLYRPLASVLPFGNGELLSFLDVAVPVVRAYID